MNPWVFEATPPGENANVPAKLEELNKTYGTPNLISEVALEELLGVGWVKSMGNLGKS